jgi:predicted AlkP superfamily phosphohydrolase/phosphomutase/tetratricopeptide (TPR) repeat protein
VNKLKYFFLGFTPMTTPKKKVLVIGWDAADWKVIHPLMDAGKMPHLQNLVERGAMGRCATLHPPLSPMLWTSIATGKRPFKHGIHGFAEPTPDGRGVRPITNLSRTTKTVWNILNQNDYRSIVVGWWPSHPAEPVNGVMVSDQFHKAFRPIEQGWPMPAHTVHPPELQEALAECRMHPQELLGPMMVPFLPHLEKVDQVKDRRFSGLGKTIAECVSIHSAATWLLEHQSWDFFAVYYDAIDHFCHGFMKYHPPRQDWVSEDDFERYSNVVRAAYQFHDQMLGTLLSKVPADTTVILMSDHGFHADHLRPRAIPDFPAGPAFEHSPYGIFVIAGPGIKRDEPLFGVNVLDLTPTVLTLFDLPVGADMDGDVIASAFENPPEIRTIPTWDDVAGNDGRHPPHTRLDPVAAAEAMEQLVALGYVEKPGENIEEYIAHTVDELRFNLLEAYQDGNRHAEALEIARDLCRRNPDDQRYALKRFLACQALGHVSEMREIVDDMDGRRREVYRAAVARLSELRDLAKKRFEEKKAAAGETIDPKECERELQFELNPLSQPDKPREFLLTPDERKELEKTLRKKRYHPAITDLLQAQCLAAERRLLPALEILERLGTTQTIGPAILLQTADLLRRLRRLPESEMVYERALAFDPDNTQAHLGMARLALSRREYQRAADSAGAALGRLYFSPKAHFLQGVAFAGLREFAQAADSFRTALSQNPHFPEAHLMLARMLKFRLNDPEAAAEHFRWYREMQRRRPEQPKKLARQTEAPAPAVILTHKGAPLPPLGDDVLIVSGLPRSGTSMVMQMLDAGGMPILTDALRQADQDNPRGYFEHEAVKALFRDQSWLTEARGKALKVVVPLVRNLPTGCNYRILLIDRDFDEILASQAKMIARRGESIAETPDRSDRLRCEFARQIAQTMSQLGQTEDVRLLSIRHSDVIRDPAASARLINEFAGGGLDCARMSAAVDRSLHRNRRALVDA